MKQKKSQTSLMKKDQKYLNSEQNILKNFRIIFRALRAHAKSVEKGTGTNTTQLWMLWEISKAPGIKVTKLSEILSIHQTTCSNILDKIQQKDLIRRDRSGPDQRIVHLYLTEKGARLLADAPEPAQGLIVDALRRMPDEVLASLEESLNTLVGALHTIEKDAGLKPLDI